ncbi:DNA-methyltransferase [Robertmurraya massiliosenegalensis]|uniref:DNA-methyltransferase n=1 Tax=Robertmurraya massiliosenegalensis TaxID=1287657 RepID=UPI0002D5B42E|nr:site-specific DNA-methyltransferase [Robertmurraya massiliosenegalensis]
MEFRNQILNGDCLEMMKQLPDNSIATCITDPPYNYEFIGRNWDVEEIKRRTERVQNSNTLVKNIPYGSGLAGGVRNERWYKKNRDNIVEYQKWIEDWGRELYRILKPGALVFTFNSTRTIAQVQVALENVGFYARDIIVYRRHSGIPKGLNVAKKLEKMGAENPEQWEGWHSALRNEWEAISVVQKPLVNNYIETLQQYNVGLFHAKTEEGFQSNIIENIKRDKNDDFNIHVTVKPMELIKKLIELSTPKIEGNIVIDPFMGSGTTALAATELGIDYVGIEIVDEYCEIIRKRLENLKQKQELEGEQQDLFSMIND